MNMNYRSKRVVVSTATLVTISNHIFQTKIQQHNIIVILYTTMICVILITILNINHT